MRYKINFSEKRILFALALVLAFLILYFFVSSLFFPDSNWIIAKDNAIKLVSGKTITQKFIASEDNLSQIEVLFSKATASGLKNGAEVNMQIKDQACFKTLGEASWGENTLHSNNTYAFHFNKISGSKGKTYCFLITLQKNEGSAKGVGVFTNNTPSVNSQYLFDGGSGIELKNQSLSMRPAYQNNFLGNIKELDQHIKRIADDPNVASDRILESDRKFFYL